MQSLLTKNTHRNKMGCLIAFGVCSILLDIAIYNIIETATRDAIARALFLLMIMVEVSSFIYFGIMKDKYVATLSKDLQKSKTDDKQQRQLVLWSVVLR